MFNKSSVFTEVGEPHLGEAGVFLAFSDAFTGRPGDLGSGGSGTSNVFILSSLPTWKSEALLQASWNFEGCLDNLLQ